MFKQMKIESKKINFFSVCFNARIVFDKTLKLNRVKNFKDKNYRYKNFTEFLICSTTLKFQVKQELKFIWCSSISIIDVQNSKFHYFDNELKKFKTKAFFFKSESFKFLNSNIVPKEDGFYLELNYKFIFWNF